MRLTGTITLAMKRYSTLSIDSELEPNHQMQFSIRPRTPLYVGVVG